MCMICLTLKKLYIKFKSKITINIFLLLNILFYYLIANYKNIFLNKRLLKVLELNKNQNTNEKQKLN